MNPKSFYSNVDNIIYNNSYSDEDKISLKKIGNVKVVSDTVEITFKPNETSMNSIIKTYLIFLIPK